MLVKRLFSKVSVSKFFVFLIASSMLCTISFMARDVNAQDSSKQSQAQQEEIDIINLILPTDEVYVVLKPDEKITGRLGLPAAQLISPPPELAQEIAYWVQRGNGEPLKPNDIAYEFNSSIRYRGNGHTIYVTTVRLTPAAAKLRRVLPVTTKLDDGTVAGVTVPCDSIPDKTTPKSFSCIVGDNPAPNQLVFERGNMVITIASDLPIDQLKGLASKVSF